MGALREMAQTFRFAGGVESKSAPATVPPTKLLALENGVFSKAISIKKRNGYEEIATVPSAIRMATRDDELLAFTANRAWSIGADGATSDAGAVYSVLGADRPLVVTGTQQTMPDHASLSGITVAAWEDSRGGVWWATLDTVTERILSAPVQADALGRAPRCVPCGPNLHVYYAVPTQHRIMVLVVNPAAPAAAVVPGILVDDLDATQSMYDACATARSGTPVAIAWFEHASTSIRVGYVDQSGVLGSPLTGHPSVLTYPAVRQATSPIGIAFRDVDGGAGDRLAVAYIFNAIGNPGSVAFFSGGTAAAVIALVAAQPARNTTDCLRVAIALTSTTLAWSAWEESAVASSNRLTRIASVDSGAGAVVQIDIRSVGLASRAWLLAGDPFAVFVHDTTFFNIYLTLRLSDFAPVGRHAVATASGAPARQHLSSAHVAGDTVAIALPVKQRLISENDDRFTETGLRLVTMDFDDAQSHQYAQLGRGLYLGGACPMHYDGRLWAEFGFHVGPELIVATPAAGGSMTSSTTYEYRAWYESTDAQGEVHRGPTSAGTLVTMGGADTQVTLTLPTLRVTRKANVRIMVARSLAGKTGDTARMFRITSLDPNTAGGVNGYVANNTGVDTVTLVDRISDVALALFDEIYTDGGILSNDPAPLGSALARGKQRLLASDPSEGSTVRYSQPIDDGYGVEWPPDLQLRVDPAGGDVTAIATRDERAIVWTERAIFTFAGNGPSPSGDTSTSGFSDTQLIPGDVGCTEPASIALTPHGHMFKSAKGIYLLANDGSLVYVGSAVEAYNTQTVRRATVLPDRTAVVFLTDSGLTLLFDYLFGQWSTFTNHEGLDAAVVSGQYHYLRTDGRIFRETPEVFSDAGQRITLRFETAWIHMLEHLQGFQKFYVMHLLGTWISPHQLGVQYQTDYTPQWTDAVWYDATGGDSSAGWLTGDGANPVGDEPIAGSDYGDGEYGDGEYGGTPPGLYEWRLDLFEKGESIQFRFEDFEADGFSGASFELTELALTGAALGNVRRPMTASRSA